MDTIDLEAISEEALQHIADCVESADEDSLLSVELLEGSIAIELPDGKQLEVVQGRDGKYLSLISPVSGNTQFFFDEDSEEWQDEEENSLLETLSYELKDLADIAVSFD